MRYLPLMLLATLLVFGGCDGDPCSGNINIEEPSDFSALASCTTISGNLFIRCYWCVDITDLDALTAISGSLSIYQSYALTNLDGLSSLRSIGGALAIPGNGNDALTNLDGLGALTTIGDSVIIGNAYGGNPALANLDGLSALTTVGGAWRYIKTMPSQT